METLAYQTARLPPACAYGLLAIENRGLPKTETDLSSIIPGDAPGTAFVTPGQPQVDSLITPWFHPLLQDDRLRRNQDSPWFRSHLIPHRILSLHHPRFHH